MAKPAAPNEYFKFFNGQLYPALGYGTWQAVDNELEESFDAALEAGYRHIDTAHVYGNEAVIGKVLKNWISSGKVKREDIFLVTKLPPSGNYPDGVKKYIQRSLDLLQVDYVDLYLVHVPIGFKDIEGDLHPLTKEGRIDLDKNTDHVAIWKEMEKLVDNGKAKSIGLSNFNISQIEKVLKNARIQPANLQIELHAYLQQNELVEFCKKNNIIVTAYSPIANPGLNKFLSNFKKSVELPNLLGNTVVTTIAQKYKKTPAQVLLRQIVQRGIAAIPKSINPERVKENINLFDFKLDDSDMQDLAKLDNGVRLNDFKVFKGITEHPEYPFTDLKFED